MRDVIEVHKFGEIAIFHAIFGAYVLVLVIEILAVLGETYRSESLLIERVMVAPAKISIKPENWQWLDAYVVGAANFRDVAS